MIKPQHRRTSGFLTKLRRVYIFHVQFLVLSAAAKKYMAGRGRIAAPATAATDSSHGIYP